MSGPFSFILVRACGAHILACNGFMVMLQNIYIYICNNIYTFIHFIKYLIKVFIEWEVCSHDWKFWKNYKKLTILKQNEEKEAEGKEVLSGREIT